MSGVVTVGKTGRFTRVGEYGPTGGRARSRRGGASGEAVIQREHVVFLSLDQEEFLHVAQPVGHLGGEVVVLRIILGDVVKLPGVAVDDIGELAQALIPGRLGWRGRGEPTVVVDGAVAYHLEILRAARGWGVSVRFVEGVRHAHAFNRLLSHAIDHDGRLNAGRFKDRRHDVDYVVELRADAARIVDVTGPGDGRALTGAAEVRRDLLGPFEWRIKGPGPAHRHMRRGQGRPPNVIELQLLRDWNVDALDRGHIDRGAEDGSFGAVAIVAADIDD